MAERIDLLKEDRNLVRGITSNLETLREFDVEMLLRNDLDERFRFVEGEEIFERTLRLFASLETCDLKLVAKPLLQRLLAHTAEAIKLLNGIRRYETSPGENWDVTIRGMITKIAERYDAEWFRDIAAQVAFAGKEARRERELVTKLTEMFPDLEKAKDDALDRMTTTVAEFKKDAAAVVAEEQAAHFEQEAKSNFRISQVWSITAFALIGATIWSLIDGDRALGPIVGDLGTPEVIAQLLTRVFFISISTTMIIWTLRRSNAAQHNYVVNRHRSNCLGIFRTLSNLADDEVLQREILSHAAKAIFMPQSTGYSQKAGSEQQGHGVVEILREVNSTAKAAGSKK